MSYHHMEGQWSTWVYYCLQYELFTSVPGAGGQNPQYQETRFPNGYY